LLALIEIQGLDPYYACLHQGNDGHAALASDLIEEFRAPLLESLGRWLFYRTLMAVEGDLEFINVGWYLNNLGRKKFLRGFLQRMTEEIKTDEGIKQPKWDLLTQQVKAFKQFVYNPSHHYRSYRID
ncbi:MAG: CRISPR-associated endonuclease Cas1, partial [Dolichospermum sp.]